jgi:glycosyltransferase involved in cell wall biosynthesis
MARSIAPSRLLGRPAAANAVAAPSAPPLAAPLEGVSVVLPCLDEADNVAEAVRLASLAGRRAAWAYEVIVVDDGSTDGTFAVASALAARDPAVRVVVHGRNLGYGAALRTGIAVARQPWILLTDADGQFDLTQLDEFLPFAEDHDLLVGHREARQDPLHRRVSARAWNALVRAVFGLPVRDVDCAFKLVRRERVQGLVLVSSGAMISTELLVRCLAEGARLKELDVRHRPRTAGRQSGNDPRVVARAFKELAALRRQLGPVAPR